MSTVTALKNPRSELFWGDLGTCANFPLFCAYPRAGIPEDASASIQQVCSTHSRIIPGYKWGS